MDQTTPTSKLAGAVHAEYRGKRREQILALLAVEPLTLWEAARKLGVFDHQISGVFTALHADGFIVGSGDRRNKPETGCAADVWRLASAAAAIAAGDEAATSSADLLSSLGYPLTLVIDGDLYDRQELLPQEGYPGVPYARRTDKGGLRLNVRVELIPCPHCGRPLRQVDAAAKRYGCGRSECYAFSPKHVQEPGRAPMLAMIKER